MALKKKNVFQGFMQDDYTPTDDQQIVKYVMGKGNNLHEVESPSGSIFLVSMPKKFRQTVWLKRGDCIVIDPIIEGKKVLGEIACVIPTKCVIDLINSGTWPSSTSTKSIDLLGSGDNNTNNALLPDATRTKAALLEFFTIVGNKNQDRNSTASPTLPPSNSSSEAEDSDEDDDDDEDEDAGSDDGGENGTDGNSNDNDIKKPENNQNGKTNGEHESPKSIPSSSEKSESSAEDGYKSRVQFLASGIVTVTNVVNDITSLENGLQSLDFTEENEDSSEENLPLGEPTKNDFHRQANTVRIKVNFPPSPDTSPAKSSS